MCAFCHACVGIHRFGRGSHTHTHAHVYFGIYSKSSDPKNAKFPFKEIQTGISCLLRLGQSACDTTKGRMTDEANMLKIRRPRYSIHIRILNGIHLFLFSSYMRLRHDQSVPLPPTRKHIISNDLRIIPFSAFQTYAKAHTHSKPHRFVRHH